VESETAYKKAIEFNGAESAYYVNLSLAQIANGKLEDSQASIKKAAELNPANAGMAYYNMGATLINRGKPKDAITFFKKAVELDPLYANAYYQLGLTQIGENETAEALANLAKYVELVPAWTGFDDGQGPDRRIEKDRADHVSEPNGCARKGTEATAG
jgi:tetratricopeptide (TPR) repeat protein